MLKYTVATLDDIPESLRSEYAEHTAEDGSKSFRLALELPEHHTVEDVRGLKTALGRERDNAKAAEKARRDLESQLASGGDTKALQAELESLRSETAARDARIADLVAGGEMREALAKHRGNPHTMIPVLKSMTKVENGKVVVLDDAGKPREGINVDALVAELRDRDEFSSAFAGTGQSGGGSTSTDTSKGVNRPTLTLAGKRRSQLSYGERARLLQELGSDAYHRLPY